MRKFEVHFYNKKNIVRNEIVKTILVESENDLAIVLKAKMIALTDGFRFDKRKHSVGWSEI